MSDGVCSVCRSLVDSHDLDTCVLCGEDVCEYCRTTVGPAPTCKVCEEIHAHKQRKRDAEQYSAQFARE
jgi:hypothetical protein